MSGEICEKKKHKKKCGNILDNAQTNLVNFRKYSEMMNFKLFHAS